MKVVSFFDAPDGLIQATLDELAEKAAAIIGGVDEATCADRVAHRAATHMVDLTPGHMDWEVQDNGNFRCRVASGVSLVIGKEEGKFFFSAYGVQSPPVYRTAEDAHAACVGYLFSLAVNAAAGPLGGKDEE